MTKLEHLPNSTPPASLITGRCTQMVNIITDLYFIEKELKIIGLDTASDLIVGATQALKIEIFNIVSMKSTSKKNGH